MGERETSSVYLHFTKGSRGHPGGIVQQTTGLELSGKIRTGARDFRVFSTDVVVLPQAFLRSPLVLL